MAEPDELVEDLRDMYNLYQDGVGDAHDFEIAMELFDRLDNLLIAGGPLPTDWQR